MILNNNEDKESKGIAMTNKLNNCVLPVTEQSPSTFTSMMNVLSEWLFAIIIKNSHRM